MLKFDRKSNKEEEIDIEYENNYNEEQISEFWVKKQKYEETLFERLSKAQILTLSLFFLINYQKWWGTPIFLVYFEMIDFLKIWIAGFKTWPKDCGILL